LPGCSSVPLAYGQEFSVESSHGPLRKPIWPAPSWPWLTFADNQRLVETLGQMLCAAAARVTTLRRRAAVSSNCWFGWANRSRRLRCGIARIVMVRFGQVRC